MEKLENGIENRIKKLITYKDTAAAYGSGLVKVFATPAMIAMMEETALKSIESFLDKDETTVGFEVAIKHFKAVPIGETVVSESQLIEMNGKRLLFRVKVSHNNETVGEGTHVRYIVNRNQFDKYKTA